MQYENVSGLWGSNHAAHGSVARIVHMVGPEIGRTSTRKFIVCMETAHTATTEPSCHRLWDWNSEVEHVFCHPNQSGKSNRENIGLNSPEPQRDLFKGLRLALIARYGVACGWLCRREYRGETVINLILEELARPSTICLSRFDSKIGDHESDGNDLWLLLRDVNVCPQMVLKF